MIFVVGVTDVATCLRRAYLEALSNSSFPHWEKRSDEIVKYMLDCIDPDAVVEPTLSMCIGDVEIVGSPDGLNQYEGIVYEIKVAGTKLRALPRYFELQLAAYMYIAIGARIGELWIWYLDGDFDIHVYTRYSRYTKQLWREFLARVYRLREHLRFGKEPEPELNVYCLSCRFRKTCSLWNVSGNPAFRKQLSFSTCLDTFPLSP